MGLPCWFGSPMTATQVQDWFLGTVVEGMAGTVGFGNGGNELES